MKFSKIIVDYRWAYIDPHNIHYSMHQKLYQMFEGDDRILYDFNVDKGEIYIKHTIDPKLEKGFTISTKEYNAPENGSVVMIDILVNPCKKTNGKRVLDDPEVWINKREFGFDILDMRITRDSDINMSPKVRFNIPTYRYQIQAKVTDQSLFEEHLENGIGKSKGLGCGLIKYFKLTP